MPCKGIFDRKYAELHSDRTQGATTAKKLWEQERQCDCCTSYKEWKSKHPLPAQDLQNSADKKVYYEVFPSEEVTLSINAETASYTGTIRALSGSQKTEL